MAPCQKGKTWVFTINNYTEDDVARLKALGDRIEYLVAGFEEAPSTGTKHLQGFVRFSKRETFAGVKAALGRNDVHLERKSVKSTLQQCIDYSKKGGNFFEVGTEPVKMGRQGERTDVDAFKEDVKMGVYDHDQLREMHSDMYCKYKTFCLDYVNANLPKMKSEDHELRDWQKNLEGILETMPDSRTIYFIVDEVGNQGKSWFSHWYVNTKGKGQIIIPAKKADMAYVLDPLSKVYFFDCPRSKQGEFIQYDFLEEVKNGYVFSSKYESRNKVFPSPHVVVFMNELPDMTKLSKDRYEIIRLGDL